MRLRGAELELPAGEFHPFRHRKAPEEELELQAESGLQEPLARSETVEASSEPKAEPEPSKVHLPEAVPSNP